MIALVIRDPLGRPCREHLYGFYRAVGMVTRVLVDLEARFIEREGGVVYAAVRVLALITVVTCRRVVGEDLDILVSVVYLLPRKGDRRIHRVADRAEVFARGGAAPRKERVGRRRPDSVFFVAVAVPVFNKHVIRRAREGYVDVFVVRVQFGRITVFTIQAFVQKDQKLAVVFHDPFVVELI